jgi:hypothetical protein
MSVLRSEADSKEAGGTAYHGAGVRGGHTVNDSAPDIEVCASTSVGVNAATVTEQRARFDVVLVDKSESHILKSRSECDKRKHRAIEK